MISTILATKKFAQSLSRHPRSDVVKNKIRYLAENQSYNSLNVHILHTVKDRNIYDCYITDSERLLFEIKGDVLRLWDLGSHAIVDNVHRRRFNDRGPANWQEVDLQILHSLPVEMPKEDVIVEGQNLLESSSSVVESAIDISNFDEDEDFKKESYNFLPLFHDIHLRMIGVPSFLIQPLKDASSLEQALTNENLEEETRARLWEACTLPKLVGYDESQLIYRLSFDDLEAYCGGKISELMLNLQPKQLQCVEVEGIPLIMVRGTAGSGKTSVGIYRAIRLSGKGRRVLLVTFNKTLAASTTALVEALVGQVPTSLRVTNLHKLMMEILKEYSHPIMSKSILEGRELYNFLRKSIRDVQALHKSSVLQREERFFDEEIAYVIKGMGISSLDEYKKVERSGRGKALRQPQREVVWKVYEAYTQLLEHAKRFDWADVAPLVLKSFQEKSYYPLYDDIIVDEAQDLTLMDRRVIQNLIVPLGRVSAQSSSMMILADPAQRLYTRNFSWKIRPRIKSDTIDLHKNYRNTRQIAEAATHLLEYNTSVYDIDEYVNPELTTRQGLYPILIRSNNPFLWISERIQDLISDHSFQYSDFAVLCRTHDLCDECRLHLNKVGLPAIKQNEKFNPLENCIKIVTLHSAKGLEFPIVFLLIPSTEKENVEDEDDASLQEWLERERTLCYVGMTRASDGLYLLTSEGEHSQFVQELTGKLVPW